MIFLGATNVTRRRYSATTWTSSGVPATAVYTDTTIVASVQPASGRQIERLDLGERAKGAVQVFAQTGTFRTVDQSGGTRADEIIVASGPHAGTYEVADVVEFPSPAPIPHLEAVCTLVGEEAT